MHTKKIVRYCWQLLALITALAASFASSAACTGDGAQSGLLGLDRCDEREASGLFSRRNQQILNVVVISGTLGVAFWEGTQSAEGRTAWKSLDSMATAAVATEAMKRIFQRPRPTQSDDPNLWRQGADNKSFPSGETAMMAAFVTPIILDHREEHPAVWALTLLPIYMGEARMRSQAHWLSDVLAGAAVGVAAGSLAARRDHPLLLELTKDGVFVGVKHRF
jgi:membrane-associated phospholipid phosphatase